MHVVAQGALRVADAVVGVRVWLDVSGQLGHSGQRRCAMAFLPTPELGGELTLGQILAPLLSSQD